MYKFPKYVVAMHSATLPLMIWRTSIQQDQTRQHITIRVSICVFLLCRLQYWKESIHLWHPLESYGFIISTRWKRHWYSLSGNSNFTPYTNYEILGNQLLQYNLRNWSWTIFHTPMTESNLAAHVPSRLNIQLLLQKTCKYVTLLDCGEVILPSIFQCGMEQGRLCGSISLSYEPCYFHLQ